MKNSANLHHFTANASSSPQVRRKGPKAPAGLSDEARRRWTELQCEYAIVDAGGLRVLDMFAQALDRYLAARRQIDTDGATQLDRFGQVRAHPLLTVERDSRAAVLSALRQLGLDLEPVRDQAGRPAGGR